MRNLFLQKFILLAVAILLLPSTYISAQHPHAVVQSGSAAPPDAQQIDAKTRQGLIDNIGRLLNEIYVYPDMARKMEEKVRAQLQSGAYDKLNDARTFASAVMQDLRSVSKDGHLAFHYDPEQVAELREFEARKPGEEPGREERLREARRRNFDFRKVERLDGNVGYLALDSFYPASEAAETASAALNFLAGCDALIVDLRQNGGGDPTLIQFMQSYFFEEPTHLNDIYSRKEDRTENYWTLSYVPGRKMTKADIYVLTSETTFSGAEEFAYNLKNLKRATIVGETTGGGAHPVQPYIAGEQFVLFVPYARAINPISKTNWEGTGVAPDVSVTADQAYDTAYRMALEKLAANATGDAAKAEAEWVLAALKAKQNPATVSNATAALYAGTYQDRKITFENGSLFYQRTGPKYKMIPMSETLFEVEGLSYFRLEVVMQDGKATQVVGLYRDGRKEPSLRTN